MYAQELVSIDASGPRPWVVANLILHTHHGFGNNEPP